MAETPPAKQAMEPSIAFFKSPTKRGKIISIAGEAGVGKTYFANFVNNPDTTVFIDTEAVNTTIETLDRIGQPKYWKAENWQQLLNYVESFLDMMRTYGQTGTLVIDTGSILTSWITEYWEAKKNKDRLNPYDYGEVWSDIRSLLKKVSVDNGHDMVFTLSLKPNYSKNVTSQDAEGRERIVKYGSQDGTYRPNEWGELLYHCFYAFQMERGIIDPKTGNRQFTSKVFCRVRKTRIINEGFKPYIVPPYTAQNLEAQLSKKYSGGIGRIIAELYNLKDDKDFMRECDDFYKDNPNWLLATGRSVQEKIETMKL